MEKMKRVILDDYDKQLDAMNVCKDTISFCVSTLVIYFILITCLAVLQYDMTVNGIANNSESLYVFMMVLTSMLELGSSVIVVYLLIKMINAIIYRKRFKDGDSVVMYKGMSSLTGDTVYGELCCDFIVDYNGVFTHTGRYYIREYYIDTNTYEINYIDHRVSTHEEVVL